MKIETIVNALVLALVYVRNEWWTGNKEKYDRRNRQQLAFRARILKMDEEKGTRLAELEAENKILIFTILNNRNVGGYGGRR